MILRALLAFLALPVVVGGVVPWVLWRLGGPQLFSSPLGVVPLVAGSAALISSVVSFYRRGRGTLAPWDPPRELVVQDLYRFNRNPMYVGVILILIGWALVTGSLSLCVYVFVVAAVFHLRVVLYEEKEMARLFGGQWEKYRASVPRWGIRWP